jgi:hypothetical protein
MKLLKTLLVLCVLLCSQASQNDNIVKAMGYIPLQGQYGEMVFKPKKFVNLG